MNVQYSCGLEHILNIAHYTNTLINGPFVWFASLSHTRKHCANISRTAPTTTTNLRMTKINSIGFCLNCFIYFVFVSFARLGQISTAIYGMISFSMGIYLDLKIIHVMLRSAFIWLLASLFCCFAVIHWFNRSFVRLPIRSFVHSFIEFETVRCYMVFYYCCTLYVVCWNRPFVCDSQLLFLICAIWFELSNLRWLLQMINHEQFSNTFSKCRFNFPNYILFCRKIPKIIGFYRKKLAPDDYFNDYCMFYNQ